MPYSSWTKIDNGREGLWKNRVLFGALHIIAKHEGEDVHSAQSPIYAELEATLPALGWTKDEEGQFRSLFRDYSKPWTATGLVDLTGQKFQLTQLGRKVISGLCSPNNFYQGFVKRWIEDDERPFTQIASAFLAYGKPLSFKEVYFGIMHGYRKGDDINASILQAQSDTTAMDATPRRRLQVLLNILESAGAIAREEPSKSDADTKWIVWDTELLNSISNVGLASLDTVAPSSVNIKNILTHYQSALKSAGLQIDIELVKRFAAALLTKRFGILTGLAGSGKTKLAESITAWLCDSKAQYSIVAVGADWTSNESLLGYADALQTGKYVAPSNGALDLLIRASGDLTKPYFLILDEMNLSHVERYFADFLSAIESASSMLALHGKDTLQAGATTVPAQLALPTNLFIIGTVNVDETTYMFSPKVLDRANVIEFRADKAQMTAFLNAPNALNLDAIAAGGAGFAEAFVSRSNAGSDLDNTTDIQGNLIGPKLKSDLLEVFETLATIGAEFGFRTAKEIARFVGIHKELSGDDWQYKDALDAQVLQKLMPKLHGSARKLGGVLEALEIFANKHELALTLEKVQRMQVRLKRDGFTSFAEN
jgi:hypothetical protein